MEQWNQKGLPVRRSVRTLTTRRAGLAQPKLRVGQREGPGFAVSSRARSSLAGDEEARSPQTTSTHCGTGISPDRDISAEADDLEECPRVSRALLTLRWSKSDSNHQFPHARDARSLLLIWPGSCPVRARPLSPWLSRTTPIVTRATCLAFRLGRERASRRIDAMQLFPDRHRKID